MAYKTHGKMLPSSHLLLVLPAFLVPPSASTVLTGRCDGLLQRGVVSICTLSAGVHTPPHSNPANCVGRRSILSRIVTHSLMQNTEHRSHRRLFCCCIMLVIGALTAKPSVCTGGRASYIYTRLAAGISSAFSPDAFDFLRQTNSHRLQFLKSPSYSTRLHTLEH